MALSGLCVPVPTLFGPDGTWDLERNVRYARGLAEAGVPHLFVLGSLGEFPSVEETERRELVPALVRALPRSTDLWVGCGAPSTAQAVRYAKWAEEAGAAAIVAVAPYYLHPTEASIERYYRAIRSAQGLPLLAYNIPSLVGYALTPPFLHHLAREHVIDGMKDTAGSIQSVRAFLSGRPEPFPLLPGDDGLAEESISLGASGAIMGSANVLPRLGRELVEAALAGERERARARQALVDRLVGVLRAGPFPSTGKYLAARLRGAPDGYRSPYDALSDAERARVDAELAPHEAELLRFR